MRRQQAEYAKHLNQVEAINDLASRDPQDLVCRAESVFHRDLAEIAVELIRRKTKVALLAGPSSSGKTTTAHLLAQSLQELGHEAQIISLDDFYGPASEAPLREDGTRDFECVESLRVDVIQKCLRDLMTKNACDKPVFDFLTHKPFTDLQHIELPPGGIAVVEGIHALNPTFSRDLPENGLVKLYISVKQGISYGREELISANEMRLCRRLVRDYAFRNTLPGGTIAMWPSVMEGEYRYIKPFRPAADFVINSLHAYEPCVLRSKAIPLLMQVEEETPEYEIAQRLLFALELFRTVSPDLVPKNSLLREFLGGGLYD